MTVNIPFWLLALLANLIIVAAIALRPMRQARGDYDFGPTLIGAARLAFSVIASLIVWLIYFAALAIFR